jgi:hypothetical protein
MHVQPQKTMPGAPQTSAVGAAGSPPSPDAMRRVLETAEHFFACRDRARAVSCMPETWVPCTLAEAIERDFAGFDLERAESDFRAALAALCGGAPPR